MSADRHAPHAAEVWRRHRPTGRDMSGQRFWVNMTFETAASLVGAVFLILQMCLEPALWWSSPLGRVPRELFGQIALGLLVLAPASGVLVERYLARRTPPRMALRPGARLALWILGSLPLASFFMLPLARRWMDGTSARILRPVAARLDPDAPPAPLPRNSPWHWAYVSGAFGIWLAVTGVLLPLAGCFWLAVGGERKAILAACAALHLAQAGCLAIYARSDLRFTHPSRRYLRLAPWLCLLPQPAPFFAMVPMLWAGAEGPRQKTLIWSVYARAGSVRQHSQWLDLRLALRQQWQAGSWIEKCTLPQGLEIPQREGKAEAARRTWIRAKTLLLPVEVSLAIGWLVAFAGSGPESPYDPIRDPLLRPWLLATDLLAALGVLQAAAGSLAHLLRLRPPALLGPPAAGLYLFITQAALAFGLLAGPLAIHGEFGVLAKLTVVCAILTTAVSFLLMALLSLPASRPGVLADSILWPLSPLLLIMPPLALALLPGQAWIVISVLILLILSSDVLLGLRYLPWILHPFTLHHLFDRQLGWAFRVSLALRALIALLPLGGLALPIWIWARRREASEELVE